MRQIDPLLPFTISSGTGGERQKAGVGATGRMRQERSSVNPPYTDWAVLVGRCLGDIAGRTEQPRRTRTAPPAQPVASALHPTVVVHGSGWVDEGRCATAEQRQCTVFARANKPAEANDIGGQGRREFSPLGQRCRNDSRIAPLAEGRTVAFTSP